MFILLLNGATLLRKMHLWGEPLGCAPKKCDKQHSQDDQVFNGVNVRTAGRPFHPLHSHMLEVGDDKPCSVESSIVILKEEVWSWTVEIWDGRSTQLHCLHQKMCGAANSIVFSPSSLHLDTMWFNCCRKNMDSSSLNVTSSTCSDTWLGAPGGTRSLKWQ